MSIFMYSPGVKIIVDTMNDGIIDLSDDITSGSVTLNQNAPHTMTVNLANHRRKYDGVFTPNDRFVVKMRRIKWMTVMSGYLGSVPLFSYWPRPVRLTGMCTLKRLKYLYYDEGTTAFAEWWNIALAVARTEGHQDGGLGVMTKKLLREVGQWDEGIHIGAIPTAWAVMAEQIAEDLAEEMQVPAAVLGGETIFDDVGVGESQDSYAPEIPDAGADGLDSSGAPSSGGGGPVAPTGGAGGRNERNLTGATETIPSRGGAGGTTPTTGTASSMIDVALAETGPQETPPGSNVTKYGAWYGMNGVFWCNIFVSWCADQSGNLEAVGGKHSYTPDHAAWFQSNGQWHTTDPQPGDLVFYNFRENRISHIGIVVSVSDGQIHTIEGNVGGDEVATRDYDLNDARIVGYGRPNFPNGQGTAGGGTGGTTGGGLTFSAAENWILNGSPESLSLVGIRALMNDTSFLTGILPKAVAGSCRVFCSAPNGDFISWFPDFFNIFGFAGKMVVQPIEMTDATIDWDDAYMKTHEFTSGSVSGYMSDAMATETTLMKSYTPGVASIDFPQILELLVNLPDGTDDARAALFKNRDAILDRFGARPEYQQMGMLTDGRAMFFHAVMNLMKNWAAQFSVNLPMTFMPELFPGMILKTPEFGIQAYINSVNHTFDMEQGFNTTATLVAPSAYADGAAGLYLPRGGAGTFRQTPQEPIG